MKIRYFLKQFNYNNYVYYILTNNTLMSKYLLKKILHSTFKEIHIQCKRIYEFKTIFNRFEILHHLFYIQHMFVYINKK